MAAERQPKLGPQLLSLLDGIISLRRLLEAAGVHGVEQTSPLLAAAGTADLRALLAAAARAMGWERHEARVSELVRRLGEVGVTGVSELDNAYAGHDGCGRRQRNTQLQMGGRRQWGSTLSQRKSQRTFCFGGKQLEVRQETDREELHKTRQDCVLSEGFGGVGLVVWKSASLLADFLLSTKLRAQNSDSGDFATAEVLELGAGCGVVGLALAQHGARCVLTDVAHVLPLLQQNVELNYLQASVTVARHDWGTTPPSCCKALHARSFDLIVAADVLYEAATSFAPLAISIRSFSRPNTETWIAFQHRDKNVGDSFAIVAAEHGLRCTEVAALELPPFYRGFGRQMGVLRVVLAAS